MWMACTFSHLKFIFFYKTACLWAIIYNQQFPKCQQANKHPRIFILTTQWYSKMTDDDSLCCRVWKIMWNLSQLLLFDPLEKNVCIHEPEGMKACAFFNIWSSKVAWRHKIKGRNLLLRSSLNLWSPWNSKSICGLEYLDGVYCRAFERRWNYLL